MHVQSERSDRKISSSSLLSIGPIPTINKWFRYIPENERVGEILGWNKSLTGFLIVENVGYDDKIFLLQFWKKGIYILSPTDGRYI